jgi:2-oxoglutarate dehydrogenase E2 component (dihydrolipoamide succinyltransferase)
MIQIKVPPLGESIVEATVLRWLKKEGETVAAGETIVELETDKVTVEVPAMRAGVLAKRLHQAGDVVRVGAVLGELQEVGEVAPAPAPQGVPLAVVPEAGRPAALQGPPPPESTATSGGPGALATHPPASSTVRASPAARRLAEESGLDLGSVSGTGIGGVISKADLLERRAVTGKSIAPEPPAPEPRPAVDTVAQQPESAQTLAPVPPPAPPPPSQVSPPALDLLPGSIPVAEQRTPPPASTLLEAGVAEAILPPPPPPVAPPPPPQVTQVSAPPSGVRETRERMSTRRRRIAEHLLEAQHATAHLTTFNEIDMSAVEGFRLRIRDRIEKEHGVRLTFMPFFVRAACTALKQFPVLNARVDGDFIVYHHYVNMGIAVAAEGGLVVPTIKDADRKGLLQIAREMADLARAAREGKLKLEDLTGGTFTITNGGVFGSLLSTPILNYPQSAILGLHKIQERPVALKGEITIRPMMYVALSYDHRIVDGEQAVLFLVRIKELMEDPALMVLD